MPNALPFIPNTTMDIVHNDATTVLGVKCFLQANYQRHTESGEGDPMTFRYTHTALVPVGTDIRDEYDAGVQPGGQDTIYIPQNNAAGTPFTVRFVETKGWNTPSAHLKVYLDRGTPPWPTKNL